MAHTGANTVRTLIVDDDDLGRRMLRSLLASDPAVEIIDEARSAAEARQKIAELRPDLVFMEIGIPDVSGIELLPDVEARPYMILVTANSESALQAFELRADDLLVKPVLRRRFARSVQRAKRRIAERLVARLVRQIAAVADAINRESSAVEVEVPESYPNHVMIRVRRRMLSVDVGDITWIEGACQYSRVHTRDREYLLSRTLGSLESELDPGRFLRVHRSAIVNATHVSGVRSSGDGGHYVYLRCGKTLKVGRTRRAALAMLASGFDGKGSKKSGGPEGPPRVVLQGAIQNRS